MAIAQCKKSLIEKNIVILSRAEREEKFLHHTITIMNKGGKHDTGGKLI